MTRHLILAAAAIVLLTACGNDPAGPGGGGGSIEGSWKLTAMTANPGITNPFTQQVVTDLYADMEDCEKDDITTFNAGGTYTMAEGAMSCSPPNTETGTWTLNGNQLTTTHTEDGDTISETVTLTVTATTATAVLQIPAGEIDNQPHTITMTLARQ